MSNIGSLLLTIEQCIWLSIYIVFCVRRKYNKPQTYLLCIVGSLVILILDFLSLYISVSYLLVNIIKYILAVGLIVHSSKKMETKTLFIAMSIMTMITAARTGYFIVYNVGISWLVALVVALIINMALYVWLCPKIRSFNKLEINIEQSKWMLLCSIPLGFVIIMYLLPESLNSSTFVYIVSLLVILLYSVSYIILSSYIEEGIKAANYKTDNLLMSQLNSHIEKQLRIEQNNEQRIKELRHDMRHYDRMIKESIIQHNYHQAISLIDSKDEVYDSTKKTFYCDNPLINTLFNSFTNQYLGRLDFDIKAYIPKQMDIDLIGLSTVLSNLIENAAEATLKNPSGEKKISIMINYDHHRLIIEIRNPLTVEVVYNANGLPVTQKGTGHGLGMTSVQRFTKQYNGTFDISEEDGYFVVRILIKA